MGEDGGGIGCVRRSGPVEVDPLVTGDDRQRIEQRRFARFGPLFVQQAVQVEQAAPGAFLVGAAARRARPRQVGLIDDRETAVEPLQRERGGVEARQGGQQDVLVGQGLGGTCRETGFLHQREPARGRERYRVRRGVAVGSALRRIDQAQEQSGARRRLRHPHHPPPRRQRAFDGRHGGSGLHERIRLRPVRDPARQHGGQVREPRVDLAGQLRAPHGGELGGRKAPQHRVRQPLRHETQGRVSLLGRDARQQAAGAGAQHVLRRGLLDAVAGFDQEEIDRPLVDEPHHVRIVDGHRQVAGARHRHPRVRREVGERAVRGAPHRSILPERAGGRARPRRPSALRGCRAAPPPPCRER